LDYSYTEARSLAISYIGISHKSSGRVRDYLTRKGVSEEICIDVVSGLLSDGYIDDVRVARSLILSRKGRKTESRRAMQQRLYGAGISAEVILAAEEFMQEDEISILELFDEKLLPDLKKLSCLDTFDAQEWMNKSFRFLLSRGYSTSLSMDTLRKRIRDVE